MKIRFRLTWANEANHQPRIKTIKTTNEFNELWTWSPQFLPLAVHQYTANPRRVNSCILLTFGARDVKFELESAKESGFRSLVFKLTKMISTDWRLSSSTANVQTGRICELIRLDTFSKMLKYLIKNHETLCLKVLSVRIPQQSSSSTCGF